MRRAAAVAALLLVAVAGLACVDDNIPPRPSVSVAPPDGGAGSAGGTAGADAGVAPPPGDGGAVLLASATPCEGMKLVVADGALYWTEEATGTVRSVSTAGGPPTLVASGQGRPGAIAVDDTTIFWVADEPNVIRRKPIAGGNDSTFIVPVPLPVIYGDENDINALSVSSGTLYFGRYTYTSRTPTDGNAPRVIGHSPDSDLGRPGAFWLDGQFLYQVEIGHNAVSRERIDGTQNGLIDGGGRAPFAPDRIATSQSNLLTDAIGMVDDHVVWATGASLWRKYGGAAENDPPVLVASSMDGNDVTGFVVSAGQVYFGEAHSDTVQVASAYAGRPRILAAGQPSPGQFAADAANIYWRTSDCRIMKLAK
jgi:hypothetical protein